MTNQNIANVVIAVLNETELDGEMMEYIINKVGMRDQMIRQLITSPAEFKSQNDDKFKDGIYVFSEGELIEYTRRIVGRAKDAAMEAVKNSGADFEYYTEIELNDKELELIFDEKSIYDEINNNIENVIDTDDDSMIKDEMLSVLDNI